MFDSNMKFKGVQSFSTDYTSLEDDKERDNLITKLKKYQANFKVLANININFDGKVAYLKSKLDEFRNTIHTNNIHNVIKTGYVGTIKGIEFLGGKAGAKLYGLSSMVGQSEEIDSLLKEIECERIGNLNKKPEHRLLLATARCAIVVNQINIQNENLNKFSNEAISEETKTKFEDL